MATTPITIFYSYSHRDEAFKEQLEIHLALLRRKSLIKTWHDRRIIPGQEWETAIESHLDEADIVLLLVSADFIASDYCYGKELARAMEKHERNEAKVIPVIVRPVDWSDAPFARLQAVPKDGNPITCWANQDEAWLDVERGIKDAIEALQEIKYRAVSTPALTPIGDVIKAEFKEIENALMHSTSEGVFCEGIPSGISDLDRLLGGVRSSELVIVAARPSMGKSDFVLNIAAGAALDKGYPVAFFSMQMPVQRLVRRLIAANSDLDSHRIWSGHIYDKDFPKLALAAGKLFEAPLYIDETPRLDITAVIEKARSLRAQKQIRLVILDSLQQLVVSESKTRAETVIDLKALAKELQVPVVATFNVSAKAEKRRDRRPLLVDLHEWEGLEQDADVVLFLYRDEIYNPSTLDRGVLDIIVAKNRNGPTGLVRALYRPEASNFKDLMVSGEYYEEDEEEKSK
jgi:replicative DNA helicase